jgi:3-deoxy-D-manno-octulosonic-acid transferase
MLEFYRFCLRLVAPALEALLARRTTRGKEDRTRLTERKGEAGLARPEGKLAWIHAASVGEAQSTLILIDNLLKYNENINILVTTGTVTSAKMMAQKLPKRAFHQFYPLDHPDWTERFLDYWKPDLVFWMESEIWPNMLLGIQKRGIPAALVNARLSGKSALLWKIAKGSARRLLNTFSVILAQTPEDADHYVALGAKNVQVTDNVKYSAKPLPADDMDLKDITAYTRGRPLWVYASSHRGEEALACRVHQILKNSLHDIMTVIVPRHPQRGAEIKIICEEHKLSVIRRGADKILPGAETDIYLADTMGELGLFYRLAPVALIGRSFSDDGGGGHNPIEAAQLNCAVLHGPRVQFQKQIFKEMDAAGASVQVNNEKELIDALRAVLTDRTRLEAQQKIASEFAHSKERVIDRVMQALYPLLETTISPVNAKQAKTA